MAQIQYFEELDSTHLYMLECIHNKHIEPFYTIQAAYQNTGRGQDDNVWHSEKKQNILASILVYPQHLKAQNAFAISMWASLRLCAYLEQQDVKNISIKWPNDIYVGAKKIAGILIQNVINGEHLLKSVVSFGLNLNQVTFPSHIPNPVALTQITHQHYDVRQAMRYILKDIILHFDDLQEDTKLYDHYIQNLYAFEQWLWYKDDKGVFEGKIVGVEPWGHLIIEKKSAELRTYDLKEVVFLHQK